MNEDEHSDGVSYRDPKNIPLNELRNALTELTFLGDDMFMRMQAFNLSIVDPFLMQLETELLKKYNTEDRSPLPDAAFLSAQSQMWIFAAYEILRTWRQRVTEIVKWTKNGGLESKLKALEMDVGFRHIAREIRASQIKKVIADPPIIEDIRKNLRTTHMLFARIEATRVSFAKHEVRGRKNSVAMSPGYGRINSWCGSLDYELENGVGSIGYISRRDIADEIRALLLPNPPPTDDDIKSFDAFMRGPSKF